MKTLSLISIAAGLALASPLSAWAASDTLVEKLAPKIKDSCKPLSNLSPYLGAAGSISAADLRTAINKSKVITVTYVFGEDVSPKAISEKAFSNDKAPYDDLYFLARGWARDGNFQNFLPLEAGGVAARAKAGGGVNPQEVLRDILAGSDDRYIFYCRDLKAPTPPVVDHAGHSVPAEDEEEPNYKVAWSLSKTPDDMSKERKDKSFAEGAWVRNEVNNAESYSAYATGGVTLVGRPRDLSPDLVIEPSWSAYVQIEREAAINGADKTNNLNFGLQGSGRLSTPGPWRRLHHYYTVDVRYLSDDSLDSAAWAGTLRFTPDFGLRGQANEAQFAPDRPEFRFKWDLVAVADYMDVDDPGDKISWLTLKQFSRVGYDLDGYLRWLPTGEDEGGAFRLSATYQLRDDVSNHDGDAQKVQLKLGYEPTPFVTVGVVYDRGENFDTLEFKEQWRLSLGLRY